MIELPNGLMSGYLKQPGLPPMTTTSGNPASATSPGKTSPVTPLPINSSPGSTASSKSPDEMRSSLPSPPAGSIPAAAADLRRFLPFFHPGLAAAAAAGFPAFPGAPPPPTSTPVTSQPNIFAGFPGGALAAIPRLQASFYRFLQGARHAAGVVPPPPPPGFMVGAPPGHHPHGPPTMMGGGLPGMRPTMLPGGTMLGHGGHHGLMDSPPGVKFSPFGSPNGDDKMGKTI